jgi:hypothetical protein
MVFHYKEQQVLTIHGLNQLCTITVRDAADTASDTADF